MVRENPGGFISLGTEQRARVAACLSAERLGPAQGHLVKGWRVLSCDVGAGGQAVTNRGGPGPVLTVLWSLISCLSEEMD